jgi:hypothetical protein
MLFHSPAKGLKDPKPGDRVTFYRLRDGGADDQYYGWDAFHGELVEVIHDGRWAVKEDGHEHHIYLHRFDMEVPGCI